MPFDYPFMPMTKEESAGVHHQSLVLRTEEFVQEYMAQYKDSSHDWSHVRRVRTMALRIAADEVTHHPVDAKLVELAALLHDVDDFKFQSLEKTSEGPLRKFMREAGYPMKIQEAIFWISQRVSFRHELAHPDAIDGPYAFELRCVQDADRLEAIGAIGVARCFAYSGARNLPLYEPDVAPLVDLTIERYNQMSLKNKSNSRNHFYEKLLKLSVMMKTAFGRAEAQRRHQFIRTFIAEFDRECGLDSSPLACFP